MVTGSDSLRQWQQRALCRQGVTTRRRQITHKNVGKKINRNFTFIQTSSLGSPRRCQFRLSLTLRRGALGYLPFEAQIFLLFTYLTPHWCGWWRVVWLVGTRGHAKTTTINHTLRARLKMGDDCLTRWKITIAVISFIGCSLAPGTWFEYGVFERQLILCWLAEGNYPRVGWNAQVFSGFEIKYHQMG